MAAAAVLGASLVTAAGLPDTAAASSDVTEYVALGDSVAAGIGAGSPTADSDNCWVDETETVRVPNSTLAYPKRVSRALGARLNDQAFCGANVRATRAHQTRALTRTTDLVTVQVGANDFGFSNVLVDCYLWNPPFTSRCNNNVNRIARKYTNTLPGRLDALYRTIKRKAPNAEVLVVGYPHLVQPRGTTFCLGDGDWVTSTHRAIVNAGNKLNETLAARAMVHGFKFVEARTAFRGREVCGDPEWINGVSSPRVHSFHPNSTGQEALGWLVWKVLRP
ncbi:SGNH/GDSL hydrolase family protein [Streptomyces lasiicapitis]